VGYGLVRAGARLVPDAPGAGEASRLPLRLAGPGSYHSCHMDPEPRREASPGSAESAPTASVPYSGTVTILFSDIRGFTEYTEQYGDEAAYRVLREHNAIVRKQIEALGGTVVKTQGDSFMVSFSTARGAILCAIAIQRAIGERSQSETGARIAVGIGINTGEPIEEGGDYFGSMVNLAARICAAAGPGEIFVSEPTRQVAGRLEGVEYVDRGLRDLKGFQEPQRLSEVRWARPERRALGGAASSDARGTETQAEIDVIREAIAALTRVLGISHLDDPTFRPLLECQAKATDLRLALSRAVTEAHPLSAQRLTTALQPFVDLLALVADRESLEDRRWSELEAAVASAFGRQLVSVAARGRLSAGAAAPRATSAPAPPEPAAPPSGARASLVQRPPAPPVDPRAAGVRWWTTAHEAWIEWKASGIAWAHVLRTLLAKHPHLLSVPIRESADQGDGLLAAGYLLLLEHVENLLPTFLAAAVERALAGVDGAPTPAALGARLYEVLVTEGRLRETYATFLRDVMVAAVPNPGLWADAGVVEHEDATVVITRPGRAVGDAREVRRRLTDEEERSVERLFTLTVQPLTTRLVYVKRGELLRSSRDLEFRLTRGGMPSDQGWYVVLRTGLVVSREPRKLELAGVSLPGLGREHFGAWIAVFNPDPHAAAPYELSVTVKPPETLLQRPSVFGEPPRRA